MGRSVMRRSDLGSPPEKDDSRDALVGKIINDFIDRKNRGENLTEDDLFRQYPELAGSLRGSLRILSAVARVSPTADQLNTIESLVSSGVLHQSEDDGYAAELGEYKIVDFLGRGGMGVVLRAFEERLNRTVALKILRPDVANDEISVQRFEREAKAAGSLQHPNVVTVYTVGLLDGVAYMAMELVNGPTLAEIIREHGPLPSDVTLSLFKQILRGLSAAHAAGLVHRDIKPSNLLLSFPEGYNPDETLSALMEKATVKIADFGLARVLAVTNRITMPELAVGTPEYMSPEQVRGELEIDARADLYSAGVVLYEMLAGRTPFKADSPVPVIHQVLQVKPPLPNSFASPINSRLERIALRLLAKKPEDRMPDADAVIASIDSSTSVAMPERRRKLIKVFSVIIASALLTILVVLYGGKLSRPAVPTEDWQKATNLNSKWELKYRVNEPFLFKSKAGQDDWNLLGDFSDVGGCIKTAAFLDQGDKPAQVLVGVYEPATGDSLFRIDLQGNPTPFEGIHKNSIGFSSDLPWPDIGTKGAPDKAPWYCSYVLAADLGKNYGQSILAIAQHHSQHPCCVSIIDSLSGEQCVSFWHWGHITKLWVIKDFFGNGNPAIIAKGVNNKLDGFNGPDPKIDKVRTKWDLVSCLMIIDPNRMRGIGPPRTTWIPANSLGRDLPYAYAYLDLPYTRDVKKADGRDESGNLIMRTLPADRPISDFGFINDIKYLPNHSYPIEVAIMAQRTSIGPAGEKYKGRVTLRLDRHLQVQAVEQVAGKEVKDQDALIEKWQNHWQTVIKQYSYIKESDQDYRRGEVQ